jgi:hypothetical protein
MASRAGYVGAATFSSAFLSKTAVVRCSHSRKFLFICFTPSLPLNRRGFHILYDVPYVDDVEH